MVTDAGIYWILDGSLDHYSLNSCRSKMSLFTQMYRDSKIAELFSCGCTKFSYIIGFGIGPYFQSLLDEALKEASYFVCSFDESYKGPRPYRIYHAKRHVFGSTHSRTPENIRCDQNIFVVKHPTLDHCKESNCNRPSYYTIKTLFDQNRNITIKITKPSFHEWYSKLLH